MMIELTPVTGKEEKSSLTPQMRVLSEFSRGPQQQGHGEDGSELGAER